MEQLSIWDDLVKDQSEHEKIQKEHREKQQKRIEDGKQKDENFKWIIDDCYSKETKGIYTTMEPGKTYIMLEGFGKMARLYKIHAERGDFVYKVSKNGQWRFEDEPFYLVFHSKFIEMDEEHWWSLTKDERCKLNSKLKKEHWIDEGD